MKDFLHSIIGLIISVSTIFFASSLFLKSLREGNDIACLFSLLVALIWITRLQFFNYIDKLNAE